MGGIAVVGHICVDLTPHLGTAVRIDPGRLLNVGPLRISLGGCVANTGMALADLGLPVQVSANVGDDELGRLAAELVAAHPGLIGAPRVVPGGSTSYSLVIEPAGTDRTFWHHTGVNDLLRGEDVAVSGLDLMHVGYPPLLPGLLTDDGAPLATLLERARVEGATTSLDLAVVDPTSPAGGLDWESILRRVMPLCDVVSPSLDDLNSALGDATADDFADRLLSWGCGIVAISDGPEGLLVRAAGLQRLRRAGRVVGPLARLWAEADLRVEPVRVEEVGTTNGAGDVSTAALLCALIRAAGPEQAGGLAVAAAAAVIGGDRPTPEAVTRLRADLADLVSPLGSIERRPGRARPALDRH